MVQTILANIDALQAYHSWTPDRTGLSLAILIGATVGFLIAGACLFTVREYHASDEMRK